MVEFAAMTTCTQTRHGVAAHRTDWQSVLANSVRSPAELCRLLELDPALATEAERAADGFPLFAPRPYLTRIRPGDPTDPLLLQILPRAAETVPTPGFDPDPLGEVDALCGPSLLRKYQGRVLMVTTGRCAVHCRFCFRRHFPFKELAPAEAGWGPSLREIAADHSIREVILSGGDPLVLPDRVLARLTDQLAAIPHLRRLRVHSRLPVVIPQRITGDLISWLRGSRLSPILVVHVNHPAEIDQEVARSFARLIDAGIPVLNQSVLLRGVNDRADVLAELCERLANLRVIPYYLHQLDPVAGAAHFRVSPETGTALIAELHAQLPGYAVPRYVRETQGGSSKEPLA